MGQNQDGGASIDTNTDSDRYQDYDYDYDNCHQKKYRRLSRDTGGGSIAVGPETLLVSLKVAKKHLRRLLRGQKIAKDAEEDKDDSDWHE